MILNEKFIYYIVIFIKNINILSLNMNIQVQIKQDGIKALDRDGANSIIYFSSGKEMEQPFKFHGLELSEKITGLE